MSTSSATKNNISLGNCDLICLQLKQRPISLQSAISTLVRCLNQAFGRGAKSSGENCCMGDGAGVAQWVTRVNILVVGGGEQGKEDLAIYLNSTM